MQLKLIALSAMLAAGATSAGSLPQQCAPMEVLHSGSAGLSYQLSCTAGDWKLQYSGAVPAGTAATVAQYRLQGQHADGSQFKQTRSVRVPSAALLGQALIREAIQLPSGDLALRDCPDFGCRVYRPFGGSAELAKATITIKPETQRLIEEGAQLRSLLQQKTQELEAKSLELTQTEVDLAGLLDASKAAQAQASDAQRTAAAREVELTTRVDRLQSELNVLSQSVKDAQTGETHYKAALAQQAEGMDRLQQATKAQQEAYRATLDEHLKNQLGRQAAEHAAQRGKLQGELDQVRGELTRTQAALSESREALTQLMDAPSPQSAELEALKAQHLKDQAELTHRSGQYEAQLESLKTKIRAEQSQSAQKAQAAQQKLVELTQELERNKALLAEAQAARATIQTSASSTPDAQVAELRAQLEAAQAQVKGREAAAQQVMDLTEQVRGLQAQLSSVNQELAKAREVPAEYRNADTPVQERLAQLEQAVSSAASSDAALKGELQSVTASRQEALTQVDSLTQKLQTLSVDFDQMAASRLEAYEGARALANQTLDLIEQYEALEKAKQEADAALASSTNKVLELSTKLEAANLTRDLALQAATTANADTDTQYLKTQEMAARLARSEEDKAQALAQRDEALAQVKALQAQLEAAQSKAVENPKAPST